MQDSKSVLVTITKKRVTQEKFLLDKESFDSWDFKNEIYLETHNLIEKEKNEFSDNIIEFEKTITTKELINKEQTNDKY